MMGAHGMVSSIASSDSIDNNTKGKKTKRKRSLYSLSVTPSTIASSSSSDISGSDITEDEDMANCLILLAQGAGGAGGGDRASRANKHRVEKMKIQRLTAADDGNEKFIFYVCKTCNKRFPTFQALGGHRAGHKMAKASAGLALEPPADEKKSDCLQMNAMGSGSLPSINNNVVNSIIRNSCKPRIHECLLCGAEFSSGQALGGHMRRHRPTKSPESPAIVVQAKSMKSSLVLLDLNLPAPVDDDRTERTKKISNAFSYVTKQTIPLSWSTVTTD